MKYDLKTERKDESGAIMLEIIAVLALMGVMGAMLFRQINHRNQELHNIQMASEARIMKEAFSAWIQANLATLRRDCRAESTIDVIPCSINYSAQYGSTAIGQAIVNDGFLPDGYDGSGVYADSIAYDYNLSLFSYWRGNATSGAPAYYGVVIPNPNILPDGGGETTTWNFKRAARVAMLIGGDGGVYGPDITGDSLSGSAGSWQLDTKTGSTLLFMTSDQAQLPIYGAVTGFDVYQPEVEVEDVKVNIPKDFGMVVRDLGSYGAFAVGMGDANCYDSRIQHHTALGDGTINPDTVKIPKNDGSCQAVLWVDGADSKVYTSKDIEVGYDPVTGASSVSIKGESDKAGKVIVYDDQGRANIILEGKTDASTSTAANTLTFKDGKILTNKTTGNVGATGSQEQYQYQLDPANTSVVYDIRLGAMGGMKLSELLPDVILKDVGRISSGGRVTKPSCPKGYVPAILVIPGHQTPRVAEGSAAPQILLPNSSDPNSPVIGYLRPPQLKIKDSEDQEIVNLGTDPAYTPIFAQEPTPKESAAVSEWTISGSSTTYLRYIAYQTFCVKDGTIGAASGNDVQNLNSTTKVGTASTSLTATDCATMGFDFSSGKCVVWTLNHINAVADAEQKEKLCRSAGYFWDDKETGSNKCKTAKPSQQQGD
ncbi:MAG: hypothetical protein J6Y85_01025 [Alphaproteobacteria bacterium]|nr:hypothetical protein [Alphaproteobacteria bacterium]